MSFDIRDTETTIVSKTWYHYWSVPDEDKYILIRDNAGLIRLGRYNSYSNKYMYTTGNCAFDFWHEAQNVKDWSYLQLDEQ